MRVGFLPANCEGSDSTPSIRVGAGTGESGGNPGQAEELR
jgi:hypothetical protein